MTCGNVLLIQRNDMAKGAFFRRRYVCFVITTFQLGIVIDGAMARVFFLVGGMQRLFKRVKYSVEIFNLHISREIQKEKKQSRKYSRWVVLNCYLFA